jgi:hypothetical protein
MYFILNSGYLLMLVALAIRNILVLRVILISAQGLLAAYHLVTGNYVVLIWNCLFLAINLFQVTVLLRQRRPVTIPEAAKDIYEDTFHEMSKRQFLYFWKIGKEEIQEPGTIVREGDALDKVMLILSGAASVIKNSHEIAELTRGSFIAEMSFLSGEPASADVACEQPVTMITWSQENLRNLKSLNFELWIKIQHVLSRDLVGKIKRVSLRLNQER